MDCRVMYQDSNSHSFAHGGHWKIPCFSVQVEGGGRGLAEITAGEKVHKKVIFPGGWAMEHRPEQKYNEQSRDC